MPPGPGSRIDAAAPLAEGAALELDPDELAAAVAAAGEDELRAHPRALLHLARALEPALRVQERMDALDRLEQLTDDPGLRLQVRAERAIDLAKENRLDESEALAASVLGQAAAGGREQAVARARAVEALGRVYAWRGTAAATARARELLGEAADAYAALDVPSWQGSALFWSANVVSFQRGDLQEAVDGMRAALALLPSTRASMVQVFLGDVLACLGDFDGAAAAFAAAEGLARGEPTLVAYVGWSRARLASYSGDAGRTLRLVAEVDRDLAGLDIPNTLATWHADAAELLDRVGEPAEARRQLGLAQAMFPADEFVRQAEATLLARRGDPGEAVEALRQVLREPWLERRLLWRNTLLTAWATLRAGRPGAGELAATALEQAAELGGTRVALAMEPGLTRALLPLAAAAGSAAAASLLHPSGAAVRLLGEAAVRRDGGTEAFPAGKPGELARLALSAPGGVDADEALETLWPGEDPEASRPRLRQVLSRLGSRLPGLVARDGSRIAGNAWVDLLAFETAAASALSGRDVEAAQAALALWGGVPLPTDAYSGWAVTRRERLVRTRLRLLDLLADDAADRGADDDAARLLELAIEDDEFDESRYLRAARHRLALGQRAAARSLADRGRAALAALGLPEPAEFASLRRQLAAPA